jgi:hypothetical protein
VPNVLWGNYLLTVYGIPSLTNVPTYLCKPLSRTLQFAVPDDTILGAQTMLASAGLDLCADPDCIVVRFKRRPLPVKHFHLDIKEQHICLYPLSQVLPNVSDITDSGGKIISASDAGLPQPRIGFGKGAFSPEYGSVRVPSAACFAEACVINFARLVRNTDSSQPRHSGYYLSWAAYMFDYVYPCGHLDMDSLQKPVREFLTDPFLTTGSEAFVAAKEKLIACNL